LTPGNLPNASCQEELVVIFERCENGFAEKTICQHAAGKDVDHGADPEGERVFARKLNGAWEE